MVIVVAMREDEWQRVHGLLQGGRGTDGVACLAVVHRERRRARHRSRARERFVTHTLLRRELSLEASDVVEEAVVT